MARRRVLTIMVGFVAPVPEAPHGSYVVAGPVRTGTIGDILRASYTPGRAADDDFTRLLECIDRSATAS